MKSIAQSNTALIAAGDNPYLTQRQIQANSSSSAKDQPFSFQSATMRRNQLALDLQLGKYQGVGKVTLATINQAGDNRTAPKIITAGIFNAAAHARAEPAKSALNQVLPLLERRPYDVGLILVIVQLYVLADKTTTATTLLEAFLARLEGATSSSDHSTSYIPGLVAILVSLYAHQDRTSSIKTQLSKAAAYWRNKPERVLPPTNFLISAGLAMLDQPGDSDIELAQDLFQSVFAQNSQSVIAVAGMAAATTKAGSVSEEIQSRLPTVEKLTAGINVAGLETAGIAKLPATASTATTGSKRAAPPESTTTIPKKKRRQGKLPRDYEPNKQPDPERWLPLRDRSNWRPKGKKGKGRAPGGERGGMTQGGIVSDELSRLTTPAPSAGVVQSKKAASSKKASRKR
jgi:signal recognition particle subunit SRP72